MQGQPIAGAPGWRVSQRAPAAAEGAAGAPSGAQAATLGETVRSGPPGAFARSPRRVAGGARRGRGISLLAFAAAAVVVVCALSLAVLDMQPRDGSPVGYQGPAIAPATGADG